jgi:citrate lyase beta subunit
MVTLPKVENPSEIEQVSAALSRLELERSVVRCIAILPTIESPRGLRLAHAIAGADARVAGLQLGLVDLFEPLGVSAEDPFAAQHIRLQLRLVAVKRRCRVSIAHFQALRIWTVLQRTLQLHADWVSPARAASTPVRLQSPIKSFLH